MPQNPRAESRGLEPEAGRRRSTRLRHEKVRGCTGVKSVRTVGNLQTLYYFNVNVDNDGFKASGFARFCERLGTGDSIGREHLYLMHRANFLRCRSFILQFTRLILQATLAYRLIGLTRLARRLRPFGARRSRLLCSLSGINQNWRENRRPVESIRASGSATAGGRKIRA